ncbi:MAG: DUF6702 family protein [bacterium]
MNAARALAVVLSVAAIGVAPRMADAHPLHTTLTEVTVDQSRHTVRAVVRVFIDDLSTGVVRQHRGAAANPTGDALDTQATAYVQAAFAVVDAGGKPAELHTCGVRKNSELLWVCVEATVAGDLRAVAVRNTVLCDVFTDQVNIVQVGDGKGSRSVLFTRGDRAKRLF